tara:strand:+ start:396 stop:1436 length:1041 start_codon:yes stop_codon:yes gene_type:complete
MSQTKVEAPFVQNNANFRNLFINGDMSIAQRGTSTSSVSSGTTFPCCDRWKFQLSSAGTWTVSQSTTVPTGEGFANSFKLDCTSANGSLSGNEYLFLRQEVEGQFLQQLKKGTSSAEKTTLSFWVRSNVTGTYIVEFDDNDNSRNINKAYTIDAADTWEKKSIVFEGDTTGAFGNDNGSSARIFWWLAAGTSWTSGTLATSWEATNNADRAVGQVNLASSTDNEWYITGVQWEVGDTATDFEHLPHDVQFHRCQRYFQIIRHAYRVIARWNNTSGTPLCHMDFMQTMNHAPTISNSGTYDSSSGYAGSVHYGSTNSNGTYVGGSGSVGTSEVVYANGGYAEMDAEM